MKGFLNINIFITIVLFIGMLLMDFVGFKIRSYRNSKNITEYNTGLGPIEGALLGLLSLLLAFTFNFSASRYDARRQTIISEANDIGTALLRTNLYPDSVRKLLKADFKQYVEARISYYEVGDDENKIQSASDKSALISQKIWNSVALLSQQPENVLRSQQMIPAVNSMIDITAVRDDKRIAYVPNSILYLLFILCLSSAFIIGYGRKEKKPDWIMLCSFTLMITITVYLILDLDQGRSGIITMDTAHQKMLELRKLLN